MDIRYSEEGKLSRAINNVADGKVYIYECTGDANPAIMYDRQTGIIELTRCGSCAPEVKMTLYEMIVRLKVKV